LTVYPSCRQTSAGYPKTSNVNCSERSSCRFAATLFSDDAVALIHTTARGYPRAVNNLALQALVATYAERKAIVDESAARAAIAETDDNQ